MPTENRSSNTEMVSELLPCPFCGEKPQITKHHREDIYSFMHRCAVLGPISWGFLEDQQAHAEKWNARAQPAEQRQGELVCWVNSEQLLLCSKSPRHDEPANPMLHNLPRNIAGSALKGEYCNTPLYTRADPGEVERMREGRKLLLEDLDRRDATVAELRAELKELRESMAYRSSLVGRLEQERDTLRAQLAELDALLTRTLTYLSNTPDLVQHGAEDLAEEIRNVSAGRPCYGPNEWGTECGKCSKCKPASAEPSAPVELAPWLPLSAPGQIQEGDWLCFTVSGSFICAQARLIIYPGTDKEEIVYNRKKNHYFCTDMAIAGTSNHKGVLVARAAMDRKP